MRLRQEYTGRSRYYPDAISGPHRLLVAVACRVEDLEIPIRALLDTASEWCVLPADVAEVVGLSDDPELPQVRLHTRLGTVPGRLGRVGIQLQAEDGEALLFQATCFVSHEWPGPMVLGWKGCLERIRFALAPDEDAFYFASL
jgi:hypothetical protein